MKKNTFVKLLAVQLIGLGILTIGVKQANATFLNITGFETGNTSEAYSTVGTVNVQTLNARTGNYSLRINPSASDNRYYFTGLANTGSSALMGRTAATYYSFYLKMASLPPSGFQTIAGIDNSSGQTIASLTMDNGGNLYIQGTAGSSSAGVFTAGGAYRRVDVSCISGSTCTLSVDGGVAVSVTGNNYTQDRIYFGSFTGTYDAYFDDVAISDTPLSGSGQVKILKPNGVGSYQNWTNGAGTSPTNVADVPYDTTSYRVSPGSANYDTYNMDDTATAGVVGNISAVKTVAIILTTGSASNQVVRIVGGSLYTVGTWGTSTSSYTPFSVVDSVSPNTGAAWTSAQVDGMQCGILDGGATSPNLNRITACYEMVYSTTDKPTVTSPTTTSITVSGATLGGNITSNGGGTISERGICYSQASDNTNPQLGGSGVTCTPEGGTGTGAFTLVVGSLLANTSYYFTAYSKNQYGTGYTSPTQFSTANPSPTSVQDVTISNPQSYYATLRGQANPNGYQTYGHFRLYTANPGNCNADSGGIRFPALSPNDINLGSGTGVINDITTPAFKYDIPLNSGTFLTPNTTYWYCAYATNTYNSTNYTSGASAVSSFTTPDGPASPCDAPSTGNLTIPAGASCTFNGIYNGVDAGTGTKNTAVMTVGSGVTITVNSGQKIAFGSLSMSRGSSLTMARGASLIGAGVFVHDKDADGAIDDGTQYVGSTASAQTEFVRRNTLSTTYNYAWKLSSSSAAFDCDPTNVNIFRNILSVVKDQDEDGYKTSAAAGNQCVGQNSTINGRTYFKDSTGAYAWLPDAQKLSATTDCQDDPNGAPCAPTTVSVSAPAYNQTSISWSGTQTGGAVPSITNGYDLLRCTNGSCVPSATLTSTALTSYTDNTVSQTTTYGYSVKAKNAAGAGTASSTSYVTTPSSCVNTTVYSNNDGDSYGNSGVISQGLVTTGNVDTLTSMTINKPADIVNGEFMIMALGWTGGTGRSVSTINAVAAPAGWTLISRVDNGTSYSTAVYYKVASGEPASYNVVLSGTANDITGFITSYGNIDTSNPINGTPATATVNSSTYTVSAISTTATNTMVVAVYASQLGAGYFSTPTGMTPITNTTSTSAYDSMGAFRVVQASTGSSGSKTSTLYSGSTPTTSPGAMVLFALKNGQQTTTQCVSGGVATGAWSTNANDCDDLTSTYYQLNTGYADMDGDGQVSSSSYSLCSGASLRTGASASPGTDCNDANSNYYQNISGYQDADGDGYTTSTTPSNVCSGAALPSGYRATSSGLDCYDNNATANPGYNFSTSGYQTTNRGDGSFDYNCSNSSTSPLGTSANGQFSGSVCSVYGNDWTGGTTCTGTGCGSFGMSCCTSYICVQGTSYCTSVTTSTVTCGGTYAGSCTLESFPQPVCHPNSGCVYYTSTLGCY